VSSIPRAVLSEQFQERIGRRRLISAVFLTFRFDPGFFEQEILPVFLDIPVSHAAVLKLVQLEDALKRVPGSIAVYYDSNGLCPNTSSARLDIKRIPVRHRTGIFHPKNVFLLVEDIEPNELGERPRALLVASLSANLTRSGWWENVEACHIEELREGDVTRLRPDLLDFLRTLKRQVAARALDGHAALDDVRKFLHGTEQRTRRSGDGRLHTHFHAGSTSFVDFLKDAAGSSLSDMNLEVISPYFDSSAESQPLADLIDAFRPREVRVFLPRSDNGDAECEPALYEWVRRQPGVSWAHLPKDLLHRGKSDAARQRTVHAKVYRFFRPQPKRELLFIGSVNLTRAAHQRGGNVETGFLVEVDPPRRPDWWLVPDERRPKSYAPRSEDEGTSSSGGTRLSIVFRWNSRTAEAYWDDPQPSPALSVATQHGTNLFELDALPPRTWTALPEDACRELHAALPSTSVLTVHGESAEPGLLLVQEEGMWYRPSLLLELSPADILRYWALLTPEQRSAFIEARAPQIALSGEGAELVTRQAALAVEDTLFQRFAGIFHGFGCMERSVREGLEQGREREATHLLYGQKYDSLGNLLERLRKSAEAGEGDLIEQYVMLLCAQQLVQEVRRNHREFCRAHGQDDQRTTEQLEGLRFIRGRIVERDPAEMPAFLDWFDKWFLRRATSVQAEDA
jgi:hypothetical protein